MQHLNLRVELKEADRLISCGDFSKAWDLLQNVARQFRMVPGLAETEHIQLWRLVKLFERMKRESDYEPLDRALEQARQMYEAHHNPKTGQWHFISTSLQ